jgi:hypothetical protein
VAEPGTWDREAKPLQEDNGRDMISRKSLRRDLAMESDDKSIDEYLSFEPSSFDFLDRFEVQQREIFEDTYISQYTLSVEIWLSQYSSEEPHSQLRLRFGEVQELQVQQQLSPLVLHLNIRSLHRDQWEYLRYAVTSEEGKLSFCCRSFKADLVRAGTAKERNDGR